MLTDEEWRKRIAARIKRLREDKGWSLQELARRTGDQLAKSRLGNYEQGTRLPGLTESSSLAEALGTTAAHVLCLDDDQPILTTVELDTIRNLRALPAEERKQYIERIAKFAEGHRMPLPKSDGIPTKGRLNHA